MLFCPKCGTEVDVEFDFCPVCGYDLRKVKEKLGLRGGISKSGKEQKEHGEELKVAELKIGKKLFKKEVKCEVEVNGVSIDLERFTGNDKEIKLGKLTLEEALDVFAKLPKKYSKKEQKDIEKGKKIPVTMIIDREEGALFMYLTPDGTYLLQGGVRALGLAFDISLNASYTEVMNLIERFYTDEKIFEEWTEAIERAREEEKKHRALGKALVFEDEYYGPDQYLCVLRDGIAKGLVDENDVVFPVLFYPYDMITEIKLDKGWTSSVVDIKYRDPKKGKIRKVVFSISKEGYHDVKNALMSIVPEKVKVKRGIL
ncbi:zinc ribbon domain-containing protein [Thermococcus sp. SY098]|uniref:zinc ribbon domain-containing protein n=1 Tax=Thermococcus sp. SY098 TaxID=3111325 RepID=UPI002D7A0F6C|nr:zinc ribbon domain-containing protein [Thermococcus sp. SY098]WRS53283.1 zinc ribbon domain-containing protein [Thermococcus sp. SY098]